MMLPQATDFIADSTDGTNGFTDELLLTVNDFVNLADGASLVAATTGTGRIRDNNVLTVLNLGAAVDATGGLETSFAVPGQFFRGGAARNNRPQIRVAFAARKVNVGGATDNMDLALTATLLVKPLNAATPTTLGAFPVTLPAMTAATATDAYVQYNSGDILRDDAAAVLDLIQPGATLILRLTVQELVGANLAVRILPPRVQYLRNARVSPRFHV